MISKKSIAKIVLAVTVCLISASLFCVAVFAQEADRYTDIRQAAIAIRDKVKIRQDEYVFEFEDNYGIFDLNDLMDIVFEHTGESNEGDYLLYNCLNYSLKTTVTREDGAYLYTVTFKAKYADSFEEECTVGEKSRELLTQLNLDGKSDYDKVKAIYEYMCGNIQYDYDRLNDASYSKKYSSYAALIDKKAICQGYSLLFYKLCLDENVDARIISSADHAWNLVCIGEKYYYIDTTWDSAADKSSYFLKSYKSFVKSFSHIPSASFTSDEFNAEYPLSTADYKTEVNHDYNKYMFTEPTCVKVGYDKVICSGCGDGKIEKINESQDHDYMLLDTQQSTCMTKGYEKYICIRCQEMMVCNFTPVSEHGIGTKVIQANSVSDGSINTVCPVCDMIYSSEPIARIASIKPSKTNYTFNSKVHKPSITVTDGNGQKINKKYYEIVYSNPKSTAPGKYTVSVVFSGYYKGTYTLTYTISLPLPKSIKVTSTNKRAVYVSYKTVSMAKGYEIYYSYYKTGFYKKAYTGANTKVNINGLFSGSTVYVKLRTYTIYNSVKYYSDYSEPIKVKIK